MKLFVDGSLLSKYGAQGGQAGWAVAQVDETTHELVCSAHGAMPISLPVQRRIMRAELWALLQALILSEPGAAFISDCAAVLRGLMRGEKWCTAGRRPHADVWRGIWRRFRDIGKEAHVDSVTKCKAHLAKAERAKLSDEGRLAAAGNEWADRLAKDGAGDDSFQAVLCDWYKTAARTCTDIITYIGNFILRAKTGDRWPDVTLPPKDWGEKDGRWKRVILTLARPTSPGSDWEGNGFATTVAGTRVMIHPKQSWLTRSVSGTLLWRWETRQGLSCTCWYKRAVSCGVADVEPGQPNSRRSLAIRAWGRARSQEYARSIRLLSNGWHPKENRFLGSPKLFTTQTWSKWRLDHQGVHLAKAGRSELRQAIVRLREAQARPCMPDERKHLLLATGQIKWCWKCGARVEKAVRQGCL